jgi:hypothetical protein
MIVLAGSGIRATSRFSSAILADFDMRGWSTCFWMISAVSLSCFFLNASYPMRNSQSADSDPSRLSVRAKRSSK